MEIVQVSFGESFLQKVTETEWLACRR
uniref:Uncharacterized protein n=1 Tax=mine drainage metagenome TaxID=410659 RepID=E6QDY6_9ZZZZ